MEQISSGDKLWCIGLWRIFDTPNPLSLDRRGAAKKCNQFSSKAPMNWEDGKEKGRERNEKKFVSAQMELSRLHFKGAKITLMQSTLYNFRIECENWKPCWMRRCTIFTYNISCMYSAQYYVFSNTGQFISQSRCFKASFKESYVESVPNSHLDASNIPIPPLSCSN